MFLLFFRGNFNLIEFSKIIANLIFKLSKDFDNSLFTMRSNASQKWNINRDIFETLSKTDFISKIVTLIRERN